MSYITGKRPACFGQSGAENPDGCSRCQSARSRVAPGSQTYLLLGPPNGNARQSLVNALEAANTPYQAWDTVLAVPVLRERVTGVTAAFLSHLPEATAADVKGTFFTGDLDNPISTLAAFVRAEPLSRLIERAQNDWIRDALDDHWLFSLFHPIVEADSGDVFAYEALIRARNPQTQEIIGAGPLIDASVKLNLEHVFDQWARQSAIRSAAALNMPNMRLFINFMPNTIYDPEVCLRTTMETVEECGMALSDLVFEVVETEHIPDMKRLHKILDYYRSRGVGTAVDDMGAGFSSLEYLTALRPDYVKLDRDLVVRAEHDTSARQNLDMIITQAKQLEIKIIAEGIETESQMQMCQAAGADFMQGFLFGRPANPPQASRPLRRLLAAA
jgi:EAL domain-containing protein (putative c-di-GMP-specific phosphodiesterase class I)